MPTDGPIEYKLYPRLSLSAFCEKYKAAGVRITCSEHSYDIGIIYDDGEDFETGCSPPRLFSACLEEVGIPREHSGMSFATL